MAAIYQQRGRKILRFAVPSGNFFNLPVMRASQTTNCKRFANE